MEDTPRVGGGSLPPSEFLFAIHRAVKGRTGQERGDGGERFHSRFSRA
jgi:hypothetical protein